MYSFVVEFPDKVVYFTLSMWRYLLMCAVFLLKNLLQLPIGLFWRKYRADIGDDAFNKWMNRWIKLWTNHKVYPAGTKFRYTSTVRVRQPSRPTPNWNDGIHRPYLGTLPYRRCPNASERVEPYLADTQARKTEYVPITTPPIVDFPPYAVGCAPQFAQLAQPAQWTQSHWVNHNVGMSDDIPIWPSPVNQFPQFVPQRVAYEPAPAPAPAASSSQQEDYFQRWGQWDNGLTNDNFGSQSWSDPYNDNFGSPPWHDSSNDNFGGSSWHDSSNDNFGSSSWNDPFNDNFGSSSWNDPFNNNF